jgi:hypothetical protein
MRRGDSARRSGRPASKSILVQIEQSHVIPAEEWSSQFSRKWPFWERPPRHKICATDRPAPWMVAPQTHRSSGRH